MSILSPNYALSNMNLRCCLLLVGLAACGTPSPPDAKAPSASTPAPVVPVAQRATPAPAPVLFDVPALLPQRLDQLTQQLGPPAQEDTPNESVNELERTYTKHGQKLIITYNTQTRQPESFFLPAPGPTETTRDCRQLLRAGGLRLDDPRYRVDSLAAEQAGTYLGIVVTKK